MLCMCVCRACYYLFGVCQTKDKVQSLCSIRTPESDSATPVTAGPDPRAATGSGDCGTGPTARNKRIPDA